MTGCVAPLAASKKTDATKGMSTIIRLFGSLQLVRRGSKRSSLADTEQNRE